MDYDRVAQETARRLGLLDPGGRLIPLDSLRLVDYVLELELATGLQVPALLLQSRNFSSPSAAAATLARLAVGTGPSGGDGEQDADRVDRQLAPWRRRLLACRPIFFGQRPSSPHPGPRVELSVEVDAMIRKALSGLGRSRGATTMEVLLATLAILVVHRTGQTQLALRATVAAPVLFYIALDGDPTFEELLERVRETVLEADAAPQLPTWRALPEAMRTVEDLRFSYRVAEDQARVAPGEMRCAMEWNVVERGGGLTLRIAHRADLFAVGAVAALLHDHDQLLTRAIDGPYQRLSTLRAFLR